mmetsp:Transcript_6041/g.11969  ORF Transcript_6041/g.11969 Transcript_6041/m.11969 type:complete len:221 (-) Transcript_6041:1033-1695(-)
MSRHPSSFFSSLPCSVSPSSLFLLLLLIPLVAAAAFESVSAVPLLFSIRLSRLCTDSHRKVHPFSFPSSSSSSSPDSSFSPPFLPSSCLVFLHSVGVSLCEEVKSKERPDTGDTEESLVQSETRLAGVKRKEGDGADIRIFSLPLSLDGAPKLVCPFPTTVRSFSLSACPSFSSLLQGRIGSPASSAVADTKGKDPPRSESKSPCTEREPWFNSSTDTPP